MRRPEAGIVIHRLVLRGLSVLLVCGLGISLVWAADEAPPAAEAPSPAAGSAGQEPLAQALRDLQSEDAGVRAQAAEVLITQGDARLIPQLDELREGGSRAVRIAIKPVVDLLKNRANLTSTAPDTRRSAADLAMGGRAEASGPEGRGGHRGGGGCGTAWKRRSTCWKCAPARRR
ncbi:MAG: hypothetical protein MRJ68_14960 [Nitrospira sp.]|nr:hypothetical protein [Nitrospira sp.]